MTYVTSGARLRAAAAALYDHYLRFRNGYMLSTEHNMTLAGVALGQVVITMISRPPQITDGPVEEHLHNALRDGYAMFEAASTTVALTGAGHPTFLPVHDLVCDLGPRFRPLHLIDILEDESSMVRPLPVSVAPDGLTIGGRRFKSDPLWWRSRWPATLEGLHLAHGNLWDPHTTINPMLELVAARGQAC